MSMAISPQQIIGGADVRAAHSQATRQKLVDELTSQQSTAAHDGINASSTDQSNVREKFDAFVGESFNGMMLQAMHKTVGKTPFMNGGRAEAAFQGQMDQVLSQKMAKADGGKFTGALYDQFDLQTHVGGRR